VLRSDQSFQVLPEYQKNKKPPGDDHEDDRQAELPLRVEQRYQDKNERRNTQNARSPFKQAPRLPPLAIHSIVEVDQESRP
jgi:hypothetical protein